MRRRVLLMLVSVLICTGIMRGQGILLDPDYEITKYNNDVSEEFVGAVGEMMDRITEIVKIRNNGVYCGGVEKNKFKILIKANTGLSGRPTRITDFEIQDIGVNFYYPKMYLKSQGLGVTNTMGLYDLTIEYNPTVTWNYTNSAVTGQMPAKSVVLYELLRALGLYSRIQNDGTGLDGKYSLFDTKLKYRYGSIGNTEIIKVISNNYELDLSYFGNLSSFQNNVLNQCDFVVSYYNYFHINGLPVRGGNYSLSSMSEVLGHIKSSPCTGSYSTTPFYTGYPALGDSPRRTVSTEEVDLLGAFGYRIFFDEDGNYPEICPTCGDYLNKDENCKAVVAFPDADPADYRVYDQSCCAKEQVVCEGQSITIPIGDLICNDYTGGNAEFTSASLYWPTGTPPTVNITRYADRIIFSGPVHDKYRINYTIKDCDNLVSTSYFEVTVQKCAPAGDGCVNLVPGGDFQYFDISGSPRFAGLRTRVKGTLTQGQYFGFIAGSPNNNYMILDAGIQDYVSSSPPTIHQQTHGVYAVKLNDEIKSGESIEIKFKYMGYAQKINLIIEGSNAAPFLPSEPYNNSVKGIPATSVSEGTYIPVQLFSEELPYVVELGSEFCEAPDPYTPVFLERTIPIYVTPNMRYLVFKTNNTADVGGCPKLYLDDIKVTRTSYTARDYLYTLCQNGQITFNCNQSLLIQNILWEFGDGTTSTERDPVHLYEHMGKYTVKLTFKYCGTSYTVTKEVEVNCFTPESVCVCTGVTNKTLVSGLNKKASSAGFVEVIINGQKTVTNYCVSIQGSLDIDKDMYFKDCNFQMGAGAAIRIKSGYRVSWKNCTFSGCDYMWDGIVTEEGSAVKMENCTVQDAYHGLEVNGKITWGIQKNTFEKNYCGVYARSNPSGLNTPVASTPFSGNTFKGGTLKTRYGWMPVTATEGTWGIDINDFFLILMRDNTQTAAISNTFTGLKTGIRGMNSIVSSERSSFTTMYRMLGSTTDYDHADGTAIVCQGGSLGLENNEFNWVTNGIYTTYTANQVTNNYFNNIENTGLEAVVPVSYYVVGNTIADYKQAGIRVLMPLSQDGNISSNSLSCISGKEGISLSLALGPKTRYSHIIRNNTMNIKSSGKGISVMKVSNAWIAGNTINIANHENTNRLGSAGIELGTTNRSLVEKNTITGYNGDRVTSGILSLSSKFNVYCCNTVSKHTYGVHYRGANDQTDFRTTDISDCDYGLYVNSDAFIGAQSYKGNKWLGSFTLNGARNTGTASKSLFTVNSSTLGALPPSINPSSGWFSTGLGMNLTCSPVLDAGSCNEVMVSPATLSIATNIAGQMDQESYERYVDYPVTVSVTSNSLYTKLKAIDSLYALQGKNNPLVDTNKINQLRTTFYNIIYTNYDSLHKDSLFFHPAVNVRSVYAADFDKAQKQIDTVGLVKTMNQSLSGAIVTQLNAMSDTSGRIARYIEYHRNVTDVMNTGILSEPGKARIVTLSSTCHDDIYFERYQNQALLPLAKDTVIFNLESCIGLRELDRSGEINTKEKQEIGIYPNPTGGMLTVTGIRADIDCIIRICGVDGRCRMERTLGQPIGGNLELSLDAYQPGIYFLQYITSEGVQTKQFVKM